ncbi:MAG: protein kinase [Streptosporangiales bacterium]|nr:protein kinase [Streptosporangiales bacterium]
MDSAEKVRVLAGRYRLGPVLGRGGMAVVWQARDELLNRDVAVKEIVGPPEMTEAERESARHRAVVEAQTAARLSHPNIVGIYDIITEAGRPWIVMELIPYRSLRDIIRDDGPLAPADAAQVGAGILAALSVAHSGGILHRDVKPGNVMVGSGGRVVLTDFGIARVADTPATTSGAIAGSPAYIAPERARGEPAGRPADLWGLGATLYAAVEGRPPFDGETALITLTAVVTTDPEPALHAGPLRPVISGLLRKDPDERLDAAAAGQMLRNLLADDGTEREPAPPGSDSPPAPPPAGDGGRRRSRATVAAVTVAGLVVAGAVAAGLGTTLAGSSARHGTSAAGSHPSARPSARAAGNPSNPASPRGASQSPAAPSSASPTGPAGASSGGHGALPAEFSRFTNSTGFSIGVPRGWRIRHSGHYVYVSDPSNSGVYLLIDQSDQPKSDPLADWKQQQADREGSYPDYHLIRLESVHYPQAEKAADWEFTYDRDGTPVHILNRNVLANAHHAYALYWSAPASEWNADFRYFRAFASTFRPAS